MNRSTPKKRNIGQKVKYYRIQRELSQKDLAARLQTIGCDMTSEMIWKSENGRRNLSIFEIDKLTEVLNVDYNALFAQDEAPHGSRDKLSRLPSCMLSETASALSR